MNRKLVVLCTLLTLAGCATDPVPTGSTASVPPERVLSSDYLRPGEGAGKVTVKRDSGMSGSACPSRLSLNAKPMADLRTAERIDLYLPAGDYILSAAPLGACGGGVKETSVSVKPGTTATFRIGYGTSGDFNLTPTAY